MIPLYLTKPKRVFAFGCSFTNYNWPCWPEIICYQLDIPTYNFGRSGAGNQYIFSMVIQCDNVYKFTKDDLILICWTNICREDRIVNNNAVNSQPTYICPGNIFNQTVYESSYVHKWVYPEGWLLRDFVTIKATMGFLDNIGLLSHHFSMCDFYSFDQYNTTKCVQPEFVNLFADTTSRVLPSMYKVLWDNSFDNKKEFVHPQAIDLHPTTKEHYKYLKDTFEFDWNADSFVNEYSEKAKKVVQLGLREGIKYAFLDFSTCSFSNTSSCSNKKLIIT